MDVLQLQRITSYTYSFDIPKKKKKKKKKKTIIWIKLCQPPFKKGRSASIPLIIRIICGYCNWIMPHPSSPLWSRLDHITLLFSFGGALYVKKCHWQSHINASSQYQEIVIANSLQCNDFWWEMVKLNSFFFPAFLQRGKRKEKKG